LNSLSDGQTLARIFAAIESFFVSYGEWSSAIRLTPIYIKHLRYDVLPPEAYWKLTTEVALIPDITSTVIAENKSGFQCNYGSSGFPISRPPIRAREWLDLESL
jgi:hypothetical protein